MFKTINFIIKNINIKSLFFKFPQTLQQTQKGKTPFITIKKYFGNNFMLYIKTYKFTLMVSVLDIDIKDSLRWPQWCNYGYSQYFGYWYPRTSAGERGFSVEPKWVSLGWPSQSGILWDGHSDAGVTKILAPCHLGKDALFSFTRRTGGQKQKGAPPYWNVLFNAENVIETLFLHGGERDLYLKVDIMPQCNP